MKDKINSTEVPSGPTQIPINRKRKGRGFLWILFLLTLAGLVYSQYQLYLLKDPNAQQKAADERLKSIVSKVSKLIVLPDEAPQVLTLQDVDKLKATQLFFKDAQNGDIVLVYSSTAIIYSESKNKIINVGPVVKDAAPQTSTKSGTVQGSSSETASSSKK